MKSKTISQWDQIKEEIILLCIKWYISYPLTYSQLKNIMEERGFSIDYQTMKNLIDQYSSLADKKIKETSHFSTNEWRIVQIPFRLNGEKKYLYRALNTQGNTLDFMISNSINTQQAKIFFNQSLSSQQKLNNKYIDKRKHLKRKNPFKLILGIFTALFLFMSGKNASNLVKENNVSQEELNQKNQVANVENVENGTALQSLSSKEKAFLDTISWAEGTLHKNGYQALFGGEIIDDLSRHPEKCIPVKLQGKNACSTAFGRYQILDFNAKNMSFEPQKQDQWAIKKLKSIEALSKIKDEDIKGAIASSCNVWSSFPCHENDAKGYYNQPTKSMNDLIAKYEERLLLY